VFGLGRAEFESAAPELEKCHGPVREYCMIFVKILDFEYFRCRPCHV
jgi:hypothetical protein